LSTILCTWAFPRTMFRGGSPRPRRPVFGPWLPRGVVCVVWGCDAGGVFWRLLGYLWLRRRNAIGTMGSLVGLGRAAQSAAIRSYRWEWLLGGDMGVSANVVVSFWNRDGGRGMSPTDAVMLRCPFYPALVFISDVNDGSQDSLQRQTRGASRGPADDGS
jgi:hypothetical protein